MIKFSGMIFYSVFGGLWRWMDEGNLPFLSQKQAEVGWVGVLCCDDDLWLSAEADSQLQGALCSQVCQISVPTPHVLFRAGEGWFGSGSLKGEIGYGGKTSMKHHRGSPVSQQHHLWLNFACKCRKKGWWERQGLVLRAQFPALCWWELSGGLCQHKVIKATCKSPHPLASPGDGIIFSSQYFQGKYSKFWVLGSLGAPGVLFLIIAWEHLAMG